MQYEDIVTQIKQIVFVPYFGDEDVTQKIDDVVPLSKFDEQCIKNSIRAAFGLRLNYSISDMTVDKICKIVYEFTQNPKNKRKNVEAQQNIVNEKGLLNRHEVFAIVLNQLGNYIGRRVFPNERITKLKTEIETKTGRPFDRVLSELLRLSFNESLDVKLDVAYKRNFAVYNIINQIFYALVVCDKAISSEVECANMNPLWIPIRTSMAFNTVVDILLERFGIWASTKTIANVRSYQELDKYVIKLLIKNKINQIVFDDKRLNLRRNSGDTFVSRKGAESITQNIEHVLHIKIDYEIGGTKLDKLYQYIYQNVKSSEKSRNVLFGKAYKESVADTVDNSQNNHIKKTKHEIFRDVIHDINRAVSLDRSVQSHTHVLNLLNKIKNDRQKTDNLQKIFADLISEHNIMIDVTDPTFTVGDICRAVHESMVKQGKSESTYISLEDMDPLWSGINSAVNFEHLKSIIKNEMNVNISVYKLSNCRTYDDYANLVTTALARKGQKNSK